MMAEATETTTETTQVDYTNPDSWIQGVDRGSVSDWIDAGEDNYERSKRHRAAMQARDDAMAQLRSDIDALASGGTSALPWVEPTKEQRERYGFDGSSEQQMSEMLKRYEKELAGINFDSMLPLENPDEAKGKRKELAEEDAAVTLDILKEYYPDMLKEYMSAMRSEFGNFYEGQDELLSMARAGLNQVNEDALGGYSDQIREAQSARGMSSGGQGAFQEAMGRAGFLEQLRSQRMGQLGSALGMGAPNAIAPQNQPASSYAGLAGYNPYAAQYQMGMQNQLNLANMYQGGASGGWNAAANIAAVAGAFKNPTSVLKK